MDPRSLLRPIILGVITGAVFAAVENLAPPHLPDLAVVAAFAAVLILVSSPFLRSTLSGLICGVIALVTQTAADFFYLASIYGEGLAAAVLPYSPLLLYGLVLFPVAGALAGYVSPKLKNGNESKSQEKGEKKTPRKGRKKTEGRQADLR